MMFGSNFDSTYEKSLTLIEQNVVDGLIIVALSFDLERLEKNLFPRLTTTGMPFTVIHTTARKDAYHNVGANVAKAGHMAAEYLFSRGFDKPGFFLSRPDSVKARDMLEAFLERLGTVGGTWEPGNLITSGFVPGKDKDLVAGAVQAVRAREEFPRAILVPWSRMARIVTDELRNRGLRVPEDVAVLTTEEDLAQAGIEKELTAINFPLQKKGYEGMRILMGLLDGSLDKNRPQTYEAEPELIPRTSCGE
jgi:LacI family transcriptional regulator